VHSRVFLKRIKGDNMDRHTTRASQAHSRVFLTGSENRRIPAVLLQGTFFDSVFDPKIKKFVLNHHPKVTQSIGH